MLLMKKEFFDAIRSGTKRTTLRYWRYRRVRPGSEHRIRGLGVVRIDAVDIVDAADLTDADAQADGFDNLVALNEALETMYPPDQRQGLDLYLVRFTALNQDDHA